MLRDVIKTQEIGNNIVSILLYDCDAEFENNHTHFYEIRISEKNTLNFEVDSEYYTKKDALIIFNKVIKELEKNRKERTKMKDQATKRPWVTLN